MQEINERVAKAEQRLDDHEHRISVHGHEIDSLREQNIKQDATLDALSRDVKENTEIGRSIKGGVNTLKWLVGGVSALGGLWLTIKQLGLF